MIGQPYSTFREHLHDELGWLDHTLEHAAQRIGRGGVGRRASPANTRS